jgi:hypothetical protein
MNELEKVIQESNVEKTTADSLQTAFQPFFQRAAEWKAKAETLKVTDINQTAEMQQARAARLELKKIRVEADKTRASLKEDSIRYGRAVQGVYNVIEYLIKPIEEYLENQEKFAEIQEAARKAALTELRRAEIEREGVQVFVPKNFDLGTISENEYQELIAAARMLVTAKLEADRKAEADRIAREQAEAEERERVRVENERLRAEAIEQEKRFAAERAEAAAKADAERKAEAEKARLEREKLEAERRAAEAIAAKERAEKEKAGSRGESPRRKRGRRIESKSRRRTQGQKRTQSRKGHCFRAIPPNLALSKGGWRSGGVNDPRKSGD